MGPPEPRLRLIGVNRLRPNHSPNLLPGRGVSVRVLLRDMRLHLVDELLLVVRDEVKAAALASGREFAHKPQATDS